MKNKHLSFDDRLEIENGLKNRKTFKEIGNIVGKDCTTISKEIRNHLIVKDISSIGRKFNNCINRKNCEFRQ